MMIDLDTKTKNWLQRAGKVFPITVVVGITAWFLVIHPYLKAQEKSVSSELQ